MRIPTSLLAVGACISLANGAAAADLDLHAGPLPIPEGNYGNSNGCLMAHGDQPDGPGLWLTPGKIVARGFKCNILVWEQDPSGLMAVDCGKRKLLIFPQNALNRRMIIIELIGPKSFQTYELTRCGPE
jgi:hypothetical protein